MTSLGVVVAELHDDLAWANQRELNLRMDRVRAAERELAGYKTRIARRSTVISDAGEGPPPETTMRKGASGRQAKREALRVKTADDMPALGAALDAGAVLPDNVDTVGVVYNRIEKPEHRQVLAARQDEVAERAQTMSPEEFGKWFRQAATDAEQDYGLAETERQRRESKICFYWKDEVLHIYGQLNVEWGEKFENIIRSGARRLAKQQDRSIDDHYQAQALIELCEPPTTDTASGSQPVGKARPRFLPSISLLIDQQTATHGPHAGTVCETLAGRPVPPQTMSRLACDALVTPIVINGAGQPLKVGRTRRTATDAQRKALRTLYPNCPIDGVTPLDRCEYHHVIYYENGGNTDLDNLIPISSYWHHKIHEGGWKLTITPNRTLHLHNPKGQLHQTIPTPGTHHQTQTSGLAPRGGGSTKTAATAQSATCFAAASARSGT